MGKRQIKTSLYYRIMLRLTIPLFILAAVISVIQLTNRIQSMNQYYQIESKLVFESVYRYFSKITESPDKLLTNSSEIKSNLQSLLPSDKEINVQLYDLFAKKVLLDDQKPWSDFDQQAAEKSFYFKREEGKPYIIEIDKEAKQIFAYFPYETAGNSLYTARVIYPLAQLEDVLVNARGTLIVLILLIFLTGGFIGRGLAKSIVNPIRKLNEATAAIMEGDLGKQVSIKTGDELQTLADAFNHMSESLKVMKSNAEDANPLTGIPGNNAIQFNIQQKILHKQKFVVFHSDLDRFKVFNDHYGLAKGDEAIKKTANLIRDVVQKHGTKNDFVGHQGGDDFVVIVRIDKADEVGRTIIERFDAEVVRALYPKEDLERGYTMALDRRSAAEAGDVSQAKMMKFPLLGLSLAGVSNAKQDFADWDDCLKRAVKIKKLVKEKIESSYMIVD